MLEAVNSGKAPGVIFFAFDSDKPNYLQIGDTIFTKYGDSLTVKSIDSSVSPAHVTYTNGKVLETHRISHVEARAHSPFATPSL